MKNDYMNDAWRMSPDWQRNEHALISYVMASESSPKSAKYAGIADEVFAYVKSGDFSDVQLGELFEAIKRLHDRRQTADEVIDLNKVIQSLKQIRFDKMKSYRKAVTDKDINEINGAATQLVLSCNADTVMSLPYDWRALMHSVIDAGQTRAAVNLMEDNVREIHLGDKEKLREVSDGLAAILNRQASTTADLADPVNDIISAIDEIESNQNKTAEERAAECIDTGWVDLNNVVEFQRKALWVFGARASGGKTSLAADLTRWNVKKGKNVAYFTMEQGKKEIYQRMLSAESLVDGSLLLKKNPTRKMTADEWRDVYDASGRLTKYQSLRVYEHAHDISAIENQCRVLAAQGTLDVVIVDYLQRLNDVQASGGNRYSVMCDITMRLKDLAMKYNCLVVALSQFNRDMNNLDENGYPTMRCFRDSGSIEQDADGLIAIHRPPNNKDVRLKSDGWEPCKFFILKNRNGAVGSIDFLFDPIHFGFGCVQGTAFEESSTPEPDDEEADTEAVEQGDLFDVIEDARAKAEATGKPVTVSIGADGAKVEEPPKPAAKRRGRPPKAKNAAEKKDEPKKKRKFEDLPKAAQKDIKERQFQKTCNDLADGVPDKGGES